MNIRPWPLVSSISEKKYGLFKVRVDDVIMPTTGKQYKVFALDFSSWANVIALTEAEEVVLVRQYRHGIRSITLELPGGVIDDSVDPQKEAGRELLEETGYHSSSWELLGILHPNPAIQTNRCYTYIAGKAYRIASQNLDELEDIEVVLEPVRKIPSMIKEGIISHAIIVAAFCQFFLKYPGYLKP